MKKRIVAFIAVTLMLLGLRLIDNGLGGIAKNGNYTVFDKYDRAKSYDGIPVLNVRGAYERVDFKGSRADADKLLYDSRSKVLGEERIDGITVIYAYCPTISASETTVYGEVNVMIALSHGNVVVGSPLIKGAY